MKIAIVFEDSTIEMLPIEYSTGNTLEDIEEHWTEDVNEAIEKGGLTPEDIGKSVARNIEVYIAQGKK